MCNQSVNRYLKDKAMDHIDHALGRPFDPMTKTYRNHFVICRSSDLASQFGASDHWREGKSLDGDSTCFLVSDTGRRALADHLLAIKDPHRAFAITYGGHTSTVIATSAAKAKYSHWLGISDTNEDLTFGTYAKTVMVRRA